MIEKTLAIIKPDAVKNKLVGKIIQRIEDEGFKISGLKMLHLTKEEAQGFYVVHKDKHFYDPLTDLQEKLEPTVGQVSSEGAASAVQREITIIEQDNEPDADGKIRTRSGVTVRSVGIEPSRRLASVRLQSGDQVERVMELIRGNAVVVHRVQFAHVSRGGLL